MTPSLPTITVELVDGTQVVVPDSLDLITPYVLQEQGDWFEDEIRFLRRLVQPGQTVVDIGANVGVYALSLARWVGPKGQVWAFEPASVTADLLAESIATNGTDWLHLERQALSDRCGTAWLRLPGQAELNSLAPPTEAGLPCDGEAGEEVLLTTLDACLETFGWLQVDLLKIDAEGEEERILAGGQRFFRELSPLVMFEVRAGDDLHLELVELFRSLGYQSFRLVPGLDALMPFDPAAGVDGYLLNLFAARPDRIRKLAAEGWLSKTANPEPPEPAQIEPQHWSQSLGKFPYFKALAPTWNQQECTHQEAIKNPLAMWAFSQDQTHSIEQRLGALQQSYRLLLEQGNPAEALHTRWSTLARVAEAIGERADAVRWLGHLITALQEGLPPAMEEPFLPPLKRYEDLDPEGRLPEWLFSASLEADELLGTFSGFYVGERGRARLERLLELGFSSDKTSVARRRLQLLDRRFPRLPEGSPEQARRNEAQLNLGRQAWERLQAGEPVTARLLLEQARQMGIDCPASLHYIAKCLISLGSISESIALLQRAVELNPNDPSLLVELGLVLRRAGEPKASEAVLHQAVLCYGLMLAGGEGTSADYANLAIAYDELGDRDNALACLEQALQQDAHNESALLRKASILGKQPDRHEEAEAIWQGLLERKDRHLGALAQTIVLRITQGELFEAEQLLHELLGFNPGDQNAHHQLAFVHSISGEAAVPKHLTHLRSYWAEVRSHRTPITCEGAALAMPPAKGLLRVGILSAEIGDHVVSLFLEPFLRNYDRKQLQVELIEVKEHHTAWADQLRVLADAVIPLWDLDRDEARRRLRNRSYHVLVETSGFTINSGIELLAERCAPVQCHYIGFHASTGLDTIDWFIGDELTAASELASQFVEDLWRLPRLWLASRRHPELPAARSSLRNAPPVLGSFNQFGKVREETLEYWAQALCSTPTSELHLKSVSSDSAAPRHRILHGLEKRGVDPARVRFLERAASFEDHLRCYNEIDVALDATPWAGATTSFEALSMGVPVVGILGGTTAGRMTCAILRGLGRDEWITQTPGQFARIVRQLADDVDSLRSGKGDLQRQVLASPLFDGDDLARHLQQALLLMARRKGVMG
jgi:FkbM family methyltransferase